MLDPIQISVIVPFYNAEKYLEKCILNIFNQTFKKNFEVLMIDDASLDNSYKIAQKFSNDKFLLFKLNSNVGPSAARNIGLKHARGDYVYFLDVDDRIENNTLEILFKSTNQNYYDLIFSDKKWIENYKNQRENIFDFNEDKVFERSDILKLIKRRFEDPISTGKLFGLTGRLIKRSIIIKNDILFEEKLRYLEDDTFMWDILGHANNARYIKKQLYSYYVNPNTKTALAAGIDKGFPVSNFTLVKNHVTKSLLQHNVQKDEVQKISEQGFIFFVISALISYSKSIISGKIDNSSGYIKLRKLINDVINNQNVKTSIKKYKTSSKESYWIPLAIKLGSPKLLEFFCRVRARQVIKLRNKN